MGMEYCGKPCFSPELFVVPGKGFKDFLNTGKHQGIDFLLVLPGKIPKLSRESKGNQIVLGRQELVQLLFDPPGVFMVLAMGTVPVAAGMRNVGIGSAVMSSTFCQHMGAMLLSALLHGLKSFFMATQDGVFIFIEKPLFKLFYNGGK